MTSPSILLKHQVTSTLEAQGQNREEDRLHLMPFTINHDGPAEISKYFITRSLPPPAKEEEEETPDRREEYFESSFRGRYIHGTRIQIPADYLGLVCSSTPSSSCLHQPLPHILPKPQSSLSRPATTNGPRRARGRRFAQAVGTRSTSSRIHLKRKHQDGNSFISDNDDENENDNDINEIKDIKKEINDDQDKNKLKNSSSSLNKLENLKNDLVNEIESMNDTKKKEEEEEETNSRVEESTKQVEEGPSTSKKPSSNEDTGKQMMVSEPRRASLGVGSDPNSPKIIKAIGAFDHITIWNPDGPADLRSDIYARSIRDWVGLAQLVHSIPCST